MGFSATMASNIFPGDKYCSLVQDLIFFYNLEVQKKKSLKLQGKHIVTWTKTFNIKPILANSCEEKTVNDHNKVFNFLQ